MTSGPSLPTQQTEEPTAAPLPSAQRGVQSLLASLILSRAYLPVMFAVAMGVRATWILWYRPRPVSDFVWYSAVGRSIANGNGFTYAGAPTATRPPGYPLLLSFADVLSGNRPLAGRILTTVFGLGTIALAYLIARRLFGSEIVARVTVLLLVLFPNQIAYGGLTASELPFSFFILLGVWALLSNKRSIWMMLGAGAAFGASLLIRPVALVIPFVVVLVLLRREGWKPLLRDLVVIYVVIGVMLSPWLVRNHAAFDRYAYSAEGGEALLEGTFPYIPKGRDVVARSYRLVPPTGDPIADDAARQTYALKYIKSHPVYMVKLIPAKLYHMHWADAEAIAWTIEGLTTRNHAAPASLHTWTSIANDYYLVVLILAFVGLLAGIFGRKRGVPFSGLPAWIWLATIIFYLPFVGTARYHAPLIPWMTMYSGVVVAMAIGRARDRTPDHEQPVPEP
jgi:4-amino-4-deoxy-L-arabinose transferase-like glycosyltransferase